MLKLIPDTQKTEDELAKLNNKMKIKLRKIVAVYI